MLPELVRRPFPCIWPNQEELVTALICAIKQSFSLGSFRVRRFEEFAGCSPDGTGRKYEKYFLDRLVVMVYSIIESIIVRMASTFIRDMVYSAEGFLRRAGRILRQALPLLKAMGVYCRRG